MAKVTTMAPMWWPLMECPTIELDHCAVCGATWPLNRHHLVKRSAGQLVRHGIIVPKPTITLCGNGNSSGCHGKAHSGLLHFRWVVTDAVPEGFGNYGRMEGGRGGHLEYLLTEGPESYLDALKMDGWRPL